MSSSVPVLKTWYGSLQHTTNDLSSELSPRSEFLFQIDMAHFTPKYLSGISTDKLFNKRTRGRTVLSTSESCSGTSNDSGVYMDTNGGRSLVTIDDYIQRIQLENPTIVISMADEVPYSCGKRKLQTAVKRSQNWFEKIKNSGSINDSDSKLFGVVVGNKCIDQLGPECVIAQTLFLLNGGARGILLGGMGQGETLEERSAVIRAVKDTFVREGKSIPLMINGADSLEEILHAVDEGVEFISTKFPAVLTTVGHALTSDFRSEARSFTKQCTVPISEEDREEPVAKRARVSASIRSEFMALAEKEEVINLWDTKYKRDTTPLMDGCDCHCCRNYTKAYLHHLLVCHEMLAEIMIYCHNQKCTLDVFAACNKDQLSSSSSA